MKMLRKSYHPYLKVARINRFGAAQRTVYIWNPSYGVSTIWKHLCEQSQLLDRSLEINVPTHVFSSELDLYQSITLRDPERDEHPRNSNDERL